MTYNTLHKLSSEKYITDSKGQIEYVVLPIIDYKKIIELIEDFGLGLAIKEAEKSKTYSRKKALKILNDA